MGSGCAGFVARNVGLLAFEGHHDMLFMLPAASATRGKRAGGRMARAVLTAPPWQLVPGASLPAPDRRVQELIDSREVDEDAVFASDGAEEASVDEAVRAAEVVLKKLREQLGSSLRSCIYPFGTVTVTSDIDHDLGLALDPAPELSDRFTIHRA